MQFKSPSSLQKVRTTALAAAEPRRSRELTVLFADEADAGEDLEQLGQHHGGGGEVTRPVCLQRARVSHGQHQRGRLEHQHTQREVLELC